MPLNRQREGGSHRGLVFCAGDRRRELRHACDGHGAAMAALCGRPLSLGESEAPAECNPSEICVQISDGSNLHLSEICIDISDMADDTPDLKAAILQRIDARAPKAVWTPGDFLDLGKAI